MQLALPVHLSHKQGSYQPSLNVLCQNCHTCWAIKIVL